MSYVTPHARSCAGHNLPEVSMHGASMHGMHGASFQARLVAKLILGSLRLLARRGPLARL